MKRYWFLLLLSVVGCDSANKEGVDKLNDEVVTVNVILGEPVVDLVSSSPLRFSKDCLAVVSICWYEIRRGKGQSLMNVSVSWPEGTTLIKKAVDLNVVVDEKETTNVEDFTVTLRGLPDNSTHEENKKLVYELISDLKASGWRKYYFPSDPRIPGVELSKFDWKDSVFGDTPLSHPLFDVDYEMNISDWLATNGFYDWYMYSGNYLSHIRVWRIDSSADPARTGVYLINVEFMSLDGFWRRNFEEAVRPKWKELLPAHLQQLLNQRLSTELRAKAAGVSIDESYWPPRVERVE